MEIETKMITKRKRCLPKAWKQDDPLWKKCILWCIGYRAPWTIEAEQELTVMYGDGVEELLMKTIEKEMTPDEQDMEFFLKQLYKALGLEYKGKQNETTS